MTLWSSIGHRLASRAAAQQPLKPSWAARAVAVAPVRRGGDVSAEWSRRSSQSLSPSQPQSLTPSHGSADGAARSSGRLVLLPSHCFRGCHCRTCKYNAAAICRTRTRGRGQLAATSASASASASARVTRTHKGWTTRMACPAHGTTGRSEGCAGRGRAGRTVACTVRPSAAARGAGRWAAVAPAAAPRRSRASAVET